MKLLIPCRVCVFLATIGSLEERHGWFYIACRKHHKKVVRRFELTDLQQIDLGEDEKDDGILYCSKCKGKAASVFPRMMIKEAMFLLQKMLIMLMDVLTRRMLHLIPTIHQQHVWGCRHCNNSFC